MFVAESWRWKLNAMARAAILAAGVAALLALGSHSHRALADFDCSATGSPQGPFNLETWEAGDYKTRYDTAFDLAGSNQLFPDNGFALPADETGDRSAGSGTLAAPYVPPVLLKAIAYIESGWAQASYDPLVQYGETGPTLVSADCGYGIMQVTSGMQNVSGKPNLDQSMIGGHYAFNIARGAQILASKWNDAPEYRPIVGNRDPHIIENWYYALWAYNGFAFKNHPLNSGYDPNRPPYDCQPGTPRNYPYQELVLGCVAHPPTRDGQPLWPAQPVTLPNLSDPAYAVPLDPNNWNSCSFDLQCAAMDIPTPADAHTDTSTPGQDRAALLGSPIAAASPAPVNVSTNDGHAQATLSVANNGTGLMTWRAQSVQSWISVSHSEGVTLGTDLGGAYSTPLSVSIDTSGLPPGQYTGAVGLESEWAALVPYTVTVYVNPPQVSCGLPLTARDALAILNNLSGVGGCVSVVNDANCDGAADSRDALLVLEYIIGLVTTLPNTC
jgi:hypothetical protein